MKMTFNIPHKKQYVSPPIKIQPLANILQYSNNNTTIITGSIFQPIYNTGPCSGCGK